MDKERPTKERPRCNGKCNTLHTHPKKGEIRFRA